MGRGGTQPPAVTARLPRGPHDQKDAERGQRPGEAQENKITERVGGSLALPKRKGRKWKLGLAEGAVLCRPG